MAGSDAELTAVYRTFGVDTEVAFQSCDDLIQGKRTVLSAAALKYADERAPDAAKFLRAKSGTQIATQRTL